MTKPISTKMHGVLDYLTIATFLTLPRAMGWNKSLTNAMTTLALGKLGYTLMTRHELGLVKLIPMQAHLVMDAIGGATLAALPHLCDEDDDTATVACAALGLFDIAAAPMTETASVESDVEELTETVVRRPARRVRQMVGAGR